MRRDSQSGHEGRRSGIGRRAESKVHIFCAFVGVSVVIHPHMRHCFFYNYFLINEYKIPSRRCIHRRRNIGKMRLAIFSIPFW